MSASEWVVLLDAVGTVICPTRPVAETYFEFGTKFGSHLQREEVLSRIGDARQSVFATGVANASGEPSFPSSDELEKQLWFDLVRQVFSDIRDCTTLFDRLWNYYAQPDHWMVYEDVPACLAILSRTGAKLGLASNFDSRLTAIVKSFSELGPLDWIFYSSLVGFRKPDSRFYQAIASQIAGEMKPADMPRFLMVGDHHANDVVAPARLGWSSIHLTRKQPEPNDRAIGTLRQLADAFKTLCDSKE